MDTYLGELSEPDELSLPSESEELLSRLLELLLSLMVINGIVTSHFIDEVITSFSSSGVHLCTVFDEFDVGDNGITEVSTFDEDDMIEQFDGVISNVSVNDVITSFSSFGIDFSTVFDLFNVGNNDVAEVSTFDVNDIGRFDDVNGNIPVNEGITSFSSLRVDLLTFFDLFDVGDNDVTKVSTFDVDDITG